MKEYVDSLVINTCESALDNFVRQFKFNLEAHLLFSNVEPSMHITNPFAVRLQFFVSGISISLDCYNYHTSVLLVCGAVSHFARLHDALYLS